MTPVEFSNGCNPQAYTVINRILLHNPFRSVIARTMKLSDRARRSK